MLEDTTLSIPEIAEETGFIDRSHLSRVIKAAFGLTPAAIRKKLPDLGSKERQRQLSGAEPGIEHIPQGVAQQIQRQHQHKHKRGCSAHFPPDAAP